jgi:hypothetical protein
VHCTRSQRLLKRQAASGDGPISVFRGVFERYRYVSIRVVQHHPIDVLIPELDDPDQEEVGGRAPAFGLALKP